MMSRSAPQRPPCCCSWRPTASRPPPAQLLLSDTSTGAQTRLLRLPVGLVNVSANAISTGRVQARRQLASLPATWPSGALHSMQLPRTFLPALRKEPYYHRSVTAFSAGVISAGETQGDGSDNIELEWAFSVGGPLPEALAATFPERFPTMTSARKVCRRRQVYIKAFDSGEWRRGRCEDSVEAGSTSVRLLHRHATLSSARRSVRLAVAYEDECMAVVHKLPGMMVHGRGRRTVKHVLGGSLQPSQAPDALPRPHPVHRLDKLTGGLLVCAKTMPAAVALSRAFEQRQVQKKYMALVTGLLEGEGEMNGDVDDKAALSKYRAVQSFRSLRFGGHITLVHLWPHTGRKHQLRVHLAGIGHPILGDGLYCNQEDEELRLQHQGLFLWAVELSLKHPATGEPLSIEAELPRKFSRFCEAQQQRWEKFNLGV
mmetsp:Transcript_5406/g.14029  ORF Transcript_5406/g.14029 Transcript_5406/m.14029 type:complete len:429 (-) Transcript_5406:179-1465(-)